MINSTTRSKPYFYSSYIPLLQECILSYLGGVDLTKENFHLIKSKFFEIFSKQDFEEIYKKLAKEISKDVFGDLNNTCLQITPTPRISFGGCHGTSIHTDYWYGHGETAITVWVPLLNCVPGATFFSDHFNELGLKHEKEDFSLDYLNELTKNISNDRFQVLPPKDSCYIFKSKVLHGSPLNTTEKTRLSIDFRISKNDDISSAKDLENYFQFSCIEDNYIYPKHQFYKKSVLKYVSNGYGSNSFLENVCINATAEKYGFIISDQEGEMMRYGNPILEAILDGYSLSNKYAGIVVFSATIFSEEIIEMIKNSEIKVWACVENKFINDL